MKIHHCDECMKMLDRNKAYYDLKSFNGRDCIDREFCSIGCLLKNIKQEVEK